MRQRRDIANQACKRRRETVAFGGSWRAVESCIAQILSHAEPPGYQKTKPRSSIVDAFEPIVEEILNSDRQVHRKQRHTARRIFERLRNEHGYDAGERAATLMTLTSTALRNDLDVWAYLKGGVRLRCKCERPRPVKLVAVFLCLRSDLNCERGIRLRIRRGSSHVKTCTHS